MVPQALIRRLRHPAFDPRSLVATKFDSAEDKAWFGNHFLKFVAADFPAGLFTQRFYRRLSNTFGHIACYNRHGFFETFFDSAQGKRDFLRQTLDWPCYGEPTCAYCDIERAIEIRIRAAQIFPFYEAQFAAEIGRIERAAFERLKAQYETREPQPIERQANLFDQPA